MHVFVAIILFCIYTICNIKIYMEESKKCKSNLITQFIFEIIVHKYKNLNLKIE